jgi:ParB family chromosome partitioning protein
MLAKRVISGQLSVRQTEQLVKSENGAVAAKKAPPPADPNVRSLETELSDKLGARVSLRQAKNGSGKMIIDYHSLDELDGILAHIK